MSLYIYGDESGQVGCGKFFLIGLLYIDKSLNHRYEKQIRDLKLEHKFLYKELHYKKLCKHKVSFAKALVDWYFRTGEAVFKCTVVERHFFNSQRYQGNFQFMSADEMSYNVVYKSTLLWHTNEEEIQMPKVLILDKKDKARPDEFERFLKNNIPNVIDFQEDSSENHNLLQLTDLLVGCVNGDLNGVQNYAKRTVIEHIKNRMGIKDFNERNAYTREKFRVAFWKPLSPKKSPTSA